MTEQERALAIGRAELDLRDFEDAHRRASGTLRRQLEATIASRIDLIGHLKREASK